MENGDDHFEMSIVSWDSPEYADKGDLEDKWLLIHLNIQVGDEYTIMTKPLLLEKEWDHIIVALHIMIRRSFELPSLASLPLSEVKHSAEVMSLSFTEPFIQIDLRIIGEGYLATKWSFEYRFPFSEKVVYLYFYKELSAKELNNLVYEMITEKRKLDWTHE